jgi:hypothetical protein
VAPTITVEVAGAIVTEVRTGIEFTVIVEVPVTDTAPSIAVAVIVDVPALTAVTRPFTSTVATAVLPEDHDTVELAYAAPF